MLNLSGAGETENIVKTIWIQVLRLYRDFPGQSFHFLEAVFLDIKHVVARVNRDLMGISYMSILLHG